MFHQSKIEKCNYMFAMIWNAWWWRLIAHPHQMIQLVKQFLARRMNLRKVIYFFFSFSIIHKNQCETLANGLTTKRDLLESLEVHFHGDVIIDCLLQLLSK